MRTVILRRGLVALFAAAVSFGAIVQAQAAETLRIGYQKYGTLVLLKAKGTLEKRLADQGVQVQWTEFPGGPQLLEGLNVGSIDFGVTGETPPVFAQAAGADLLYVAYEPPAPTSEAILVPKDSPIKSVAELKGKKVVLNKGSNVHYLLVRALEDAGLNYTDVKTVFLPPRRCPCRIRAWQRGRLGNLGPVPGRRRETTASAHPARRHRNCRQPSVLPSHQTLRRTAPASDQGVGGRGACGRRMVQGQPAGSD